MAVFLKLPQYFLKMADILNGHNCEYCLQVINNGIASMLPCQTNSHETCFITMHLF